MTQVPGVQSMQGLQSDISFKELATFIPKITPQQLHPHTGGCPPCRQPGVPKRTPAMLRMRRWRDVLRQTNAKTGAGDSLSSSSPGSYLCLHIDCHGVLQIGISEARRESGGCRECKEARSIGHRLAALAAREKPSRGISPASHAAQKYPP